MLSEDNNLLMGAETARERQRRTELEAAEITGSRFSYTTRLIGAFAATGAVVTLVLLSVLMFVWDAQFKSYTSDNIQELASVAAQRIGEAYEEAGSFTKEVVGQAADTNSAYPTVGVQLTDAAGDVLYDDAVTHPVSPDGLYATAREASDAEIAVSFDLETVHDLGIVAYDPGFIIIKKRIRPSFGHQGAHVQGLHQQNYPAGAAPGHPQPDGYGIAGIRFGRKAEQGGLIAENGGKQVGRNGHRGSSFHGNDSQSIA